MGKKSTPKPPDLKPLTDAQLRIAQMTDDLAREYLGMSREQFEFFRTQGLEEMALARQQADRMFGLQERALASDEEMRRISSQVADEQLRAMQQTRGWAEADRRRYEQTFLPIEDQLIAEALAYDSPQRREAEAARQMADVQRQAEASRATADMRLRGMGIDPSQVRSTSMANQTATATAAMAAMAGNNARTQIEERGRALRADAANMGRGLPSQVAQGYGLSLGAGQGAIGAAGAGQGATLGAIGAGIGAGTGALGVRSSALGQMGALTGTGLQWGQAGMGALGMSSNSIMNAGSLLNSDFQNRMSAWNAQQQASSQMISNIAGVAGAAAGFFAEGGVASRSALRRRIKRLHRAEGTPPGAPEVRAPISREEVARDRFTMEAPSALRAPKVKPSTREIDDFAAQQRSDRVTRFQDAMGRISDYNNAMEYGYTAENPIRPIYYAEGSPRAVGALPVRQARDKIPAMLSEGEYVVPADVVRAVGIEKLDKMTAKYHRPGA